MNQLSKAAFLDISTFFSHSIEINYSILVYCKLFKLFRNKVHKFISIDKLILGKRWSMMELFSREKERERNWSWTGDVGRLAEAFRKSNDRAPGDVMETRRENFSNHEIERFTLDWHVARFHPLPEENLDRYFLLIHFNPLHVSSSMHATIF